MASILAPRVVLVTRPTDLELLIQEHGTSDQARFLSQDRPGWFDEAVRRDDLQRRAFTTVLKAIPISWRRAHITRSHLATFAFAEEDIIVPVGQDGLVANVAKYLDRQLVIGVNPDPEYVEGILVHFTRTEFSEILKLVDTHRATIEIRTLIEARLDDGQILHALNEVFVGHCSHQTARYRLEIHGRVERQFSSGLVVSSATGATGWARSIARERNLVLQLPASSHQLVVLVREAFPAPGFGTTLTAAFVSEEGLAIISEMSDGGTIFGDGIEDDFIRFGWGRRVEFRPARISLQLVARPQAETRPR
jgi:hypothetical protein